MGMIRVGPQAHRMLLILAQYEDEGNEERLSAAEWEAACTIMGLQIAFGSGLPRVVADECHRTMLEVARRSGLPVRVVSHEGTEAAR